MAVSLKFTDLQCREVICVRDGRRLGFVTDVQIEMPEGKIRAVVVPGPCRYLGIAGRREDFCIPWDSICRIGPDIVLVDAEPDRCRIPRGKQKLL
jgi:YlmC/YmxH family sporulation protein